MLASSIQFFASGSKRIISIHRLIIYTSSNCTCTQQLPGSPLPGGVVPASPIQFFASRSRLERVAIARLANTMARTKPQRSSPTPSRWPCIEFTDCIDRLDLQWQRRKSCASASRTHTGYLGSA